MIIFSLTSSIGLFYPIGYILQPIFRPIFHLDYLSSTIFLSSFFSGYPNNIKMIKENYQNKKLSLIQVNHLLKIASCASPSFVILVLGQKNYNSINLGIIIYISHCLPNLIIALLFKPKIKPEYTSWNQIKYKMNKQRINTNLLQLLTKTFSSCLYVFVIMFGYMLVFNILILMLKTIVPNPILISLIHSTFEISQGISLLKLFPTNLALILSACFLSFSSLSIIFQSNSLLEEIDYNFINYLSFRVIQAILSFLISWIIISLYKIF
jgi:hypothetical protein